jgi:hypothetical protein
MNTTTFALNELFSEQCVNVMTPVDEFFDDEFMSDTMEYLYGPTFGSSLHSDSWSEKQFARSKYDRKLKEKKARRQTLRSKKLKGQGILSKTEIKDMRKHPELYSDSMPALSSLFQNGCTSLAKNWLYCVEEAQDKGYEEIVSIVEQVILLYFALKDAKSAQHFASIVMLYLSSKLERGMCNSILRLLFAAETEDAISRSSFFDDDDNDSIIELYSDALSDEQWSKFSSALSSAATKYSDFRKSAIFDKVNDLMSVMLAVGLLSDNKSFSFSLRGLELYRYHAAKGRKNYGDLIETLLGTAKFVVERGHRCFTESSWYPLMYSEDKGLAFEKEYSLLMGNFEFVRLGQYPESPFLDHAEFDLRLTNAITVCEGLLNAAPKGERAFINKRLENLHKIRTADKLVNHGGGLRPAPFTFLIHGTSSIAKSSIVNNLMTFCLQRMAREEGKHDYIVDPDAICTLNEMDKYHSDYKSYTQAVLLDDLANAKQETVDVNPTVNIINFVNNIKRTAIMAEAALKGMIQLMPRLVCATTNVWETWAREYSNEPLSVLRRFQYHIRARVKPDFQKNDTTMIDGAQLAREARNENFCPDAWEFDVYEYIGVDNGEAAQKPVAQHVTFKNFDGEEQTAYQINIGELMQLLSQAIKTHHKIQNSVVDTSVKTFSQKLCPCGFFPQWCDKCNGSNYCSTANDEKDYSVSIPSQAQAEADDNPIIEKNNRVSTLIEEEAKRNLTQHVAVGTLRPGARVGENGMLFSDSNFTDNPNIPAYFRFTAKMFCLSTAGMMKETATNIVEWWKENRPLVDAAYMAMGKAPPSVYDAQVWLQYKNPRYVNAVLKTWKSAFQDAAYRAKAEFFMRKELFSVRIQEAQVEYAKLRTYPWFDYTSYVPKKIFESLKFQWFVTLSRSHEFLNQFKNFSKLYAVSVTCLSAMNPAILLPAIGGYVLGSCALLQARKEWLIQKISESRGMMPDFVKKLRDHEISTGKILFVFFAGILALYTLYLFARRMFKPVLQADGNGMSVTAEESNVWLAPALDDLPDGLEVTYCSDHISTSVYKNLANIRIGGQVSNGLFLDTNLLLLPHHTKPDHVVSLDITMKSANNLCGQNFSCKISPTDCQQLHSNSDLMVVYVACSGSFKSLLKFLPKSISTRPICTRMLWKDNNGERFESKTMYKTFDNVKTDRAHFRNGAYYNMTNASFGGLCCATHIFDNSRNSYISGFHLAGARVDNGLNAAELITRDMITTARDTLALRPSITFGSSAGKMRTDSYGIDYTPVQEIPKSSPLRFQESGQVSHFGTISQFKVRPKSSVITSPLSTIIAEECDVPQQWGPPANCRRSDDRIRDWEPYQKYIAGAGNAYQEFPEVVLSKAIKDYTKQLDRMCDTSFGKELLSRVRVLGEVETVSGVDGMKFVDAMKPNTSMGFPVNKSKKEWIIDLDPEEHDHSCPRTLDANTLELAAEARECYLKGERHYPVFKACTKDEPTKLTKRKVRVFQAAPVALQYNIRKYFLSICHFLSSAPLATECAVGINSQGPAWTELNEHITKFGKERIVAGDFKAYDQHMSARMIFSAFKIFEHIAAKAGYSKEDLKIMRGIATDVAYPVVNLNGELIQLFGSNPSGQNLTVYVNSIVNSLYQRCVFYVIYPKFEGNFESAVALTTYGDDNKMGVSKDFPDYNHTRMQKVYAAQGIEYTMAEKEAESVPYISNIDADFLKRKSRFVPHYSYVDSCGDRHNGMYMAMLDEMSIFKSLHCNLASKDFIPECIAAQCLDAAMHELFFHGRETFKRRHSQLKRVVQRSGISDIIPDKFFLGYDAREQIWMEKYGVTSD